MATIKAIEARSVHQIQSGQVIVDLNSVVKELLENSLDAGATSVEIRFRNHGLDSIEVQDNGKGIASDDYETVALKHYTSKLTSYEDLTSLDTFGFRGEALSSLCALSSFHIVTATAEDGAVGRKLDFDVSGHLKGTVVQAAPRGTTVCVENIFGNLPVRRRELEKNIKREYGKVLSLLYAYACISVGVRISVTHQISKGKKSAVFSTKSNATTRENIANVFGAKTLPALVKLELTLQMTSSSSTLLSSAQKRSEHRTSDVLVQGHISKPVFGEGRQTPDRQMFFVNSRPCSLPQISKAFNEVYKSFNVSQSPFIFANLVIDTNAYDVNVSPDKRQIMLHDQTALLESLKASLTDLFQNTEQTVPHSRLSSGKLPGFRPASLLHHSSTQSSSPPVEKGIENASKDTGDESESDPSITHMRDDGESTVHTPGTFQTSIGRSGETRSESLLSRGNNSSPSIGTLRLARSMREDSDDDSMDDEDQTRQGLDFNQTALHSRPPATQATIAPVMIDEIYNEDSCEKAGSLEPIPKDPSSSYASNELFVSSDEVRGQQTTHTRHPVQAFTALMDKSHKGASAPSAPDQVSNAGDKRSQIPAIPSLRQRSSPGPVQNAFDRMRPRRAPFETAEITVGDTTTTAVIGSTPPTKRRRVHEPKNSQTISRFTSSPLLSRGLRNFVAPGSTLETDGHLHQSATEEREDGRDDSSEASGSEEPEQPGESDTNMSPSRSHRSERDDSVTPTPDDVLPIQLGDDEFDNDYVDEEEKKLQEEKRVALLIEKAELDAARPTEANIRRASNVLKNGGRRKGSTLKLVQNLQASVEDVQKRMAESSRTSIALSPFDTADINLSVNGSVEDSNAENRLSLTVCKDDFARMKVIGQFNLGFVLAIRPASSHRNEDELFIIDQHAADEKYNYERLQRTVTLQSQRLVHPKPLDLTAVEEEIVFNNASALKANGFEIESAPVYDTSEDGNVDRRPHLITLPLSGEKTFDLSDLEELLHLLSESSPGESRIPRPKKVQRILAMRACRSSFMVGKTLTHNQMGTVVRHMGEMEKPWNCPHGRPTMRHLTGLGEWAGWTEGDVLDEDETTSTEALFGRKTNWKEWMDQRGQR